VSPPTDFKSVASAYSATAPTDIILSHYPIASRFSAILIVLGVKIT